MSEVGRAFQVAAIRLGHLFTRHAFLKCVVAPEPGDVGMMAKCLLMPFGSYSLLERETLTGPHGDDPTVTTAQGSFVVGQPPPQTKPLG